MVAAGLLAERFPGLYGDFAVGFGRQAQDGLDGVHVGCELGLARCCAGPHRAVQGGQEVDFVAGVPGDALAAVTGCFQQRPEAVNLAYRFG